MMEIQDGAGFSMLKDLDAIGLVGLAASNASDTSALFDVPLVGAGCMAAKSIFFYGYTVDFLFLPASIG